MTTSSATGDYKNLIIDTSTKFKVTPNGSGGITEVEKVTSGGTLKPDPDDHTVIVGTIKHGKLTFNAVEVKRNSSSSSSGSTSYSFSNVSGAKFNIYRVEEGTGREIYKLAGTSEDVTLDAKSTTQSYKDAEPEKYYYTVKANIGDMIDRIDSLFTLQAYAETTTYDWDSNTWELLGSATSDSGVVTFTGLVPGQKYLVRETSPSGTFRPVIFNTSGSLSSNGGTLTISSAYDYNTDKTSPTKIISKDNSGNYRWLTTVTIGNAGSSSSRSASTASSRASTARSGATTGSGTGANASSGAGNAGARGSATGDDNNLWIHLVIMLIAFDALVADLLYISRKKKLTGGK